MSDLVDKLKNALSLEREYPPDKAVRKGRDIQGAHPLHGSDTGANYIVHTDSQTWHCFRCGSHGDVLDMIAVENGIVSCGDAGKLKGSDFTDVLSRACERAGIEMNIDKRDMEQLTKEQGEKAALQEVFREAMTYFRQNLTPIVKEWVKDKYGFDEEVLDRFDIGYAPPAEKGLWDHLRKAGYGEIDMYLSGMFMERDGGSDVFQGRVVFPYSFRGDYIYFIARQTPWTPEWDHSKYRKLLTQKKFQYVSPHISNAIWGRDTIRGSDEVIVTEGITDAIALADWGYPVISPVTTRFRREDIENIRDMCKGRRVYVCNDNDEGGLGGALDTLESIEHSYLIQFPGTLPKGYDLNDFYRERTQHDFEELKKRAIPRYDAIALNRGDILSIFTAAVKAEAKMPERVRKIWDNETQSYDFTSLEEILSRVYDIKEAVSIFRMSDKSDSRSPTALEPDIRQRIISNAVERDMMARGKFLCDEGTGTVYYFDRNDHKVFTFKSADMKEHMKNRYGVNVSNQEGRFIVESIETTAVARGEKTKVRKFFHFDKDDNVLYVHNRNDHYYRLDGETIEYKVNGEEVYFLTDHKKLIHYIDPEDREYLDDIHGEMEAWRGDGSFLHRVMANRTNFASKTALTSEQQRLQYLITMYMFPFGSWFRTKPIIAFQGEKGSGKSVTLRMLGHFLTSPEFELASLPDTDKKDFMVSAYNNPLYFLDNVDKPKSWLLDALAAIATGVSIKERALYTNFGQAEAKIECFMALNARDPSFKRDDVVDRLLLFYVDRLESNIHEDLLYGPIEEHWDTLWSEYLDDLNKIIKCMKTVDKSAYRSNHRIVAWVVFANICKEALDLDGDSIDELVDAMKHEKDAFSLGGDPLLEVVRMLIESEYDETSWRSASELYDLLSGLDKSFGVESYKTPRSLANRLPHVQSELKNLVGMQWRYCREKQRNEYRFGGEGLVKPESQMRLMDGKPLKQVIKEYVMARWDEGDPATRHDISRNVSGDSGSIGNEVDRLIQVGEMVEFEHGGKRVIGLNR